MAPWFVRRCCQLERACCCGQRWRLGQQRCTPTRTWDSGCFACCQHHSKYHGWWCCLQAERAVLIVACVLCVCRLSWAVRPAVSHTEHSLLHATLATPMACSCGQQHCTCSNSSQHLSQAPRLCFHHGLMCCAVRRWWGPMTRRVSSCTFVEAQQRQPWQRRRPQQGQALRLSLHRCRLAPRHDQGAAQMVSSMYSSRWVAS